MTLLDAHEKGAFGAHYACGLVIASATARATERADGDAWELWRRLTLLPAEPITAAIYLRELDALGVSEGTRNRIAALVTGTAADPAEEIAALTHAPEPSL